MFYDLIEATFEQIKIGGWVMIPLVMLSLWMWFLITKKIKDMYGFVQGDTSVQDCIETIGTDRFTAAYWQRAIIDGFLEQRTDDEQLNQSIFGESPDKTGRLCQAICGHHSPAGGSCAAAGIAGNRGRNGEDL